MPSDEQRPGDSGTVGEIELQALLESGTDSVWQHHPDLTLGIDTDHNAAQEAAHKEILLLQHAERTESFTRALPRYASKDVLCPWIPKADPDSQQARTFTRRLTRRKHVLISACITSTLVFLANMISIIVVHLKSDGSQLYKGDCVFAGRLDFGLHILINLLSSLLLGASNLCMQLLAAPTRKEVDEAHIKRVWLDIGRPSIRNLRYIALERRIIWSMLAIAGLPLHLLYNSAIISVLPVNSYDWAVVTPGFCTGDAFDIGATNASMAQRANSRVWGLTQPNLATPPQYTQNILSSPGLFGSLDAAFETQVAGLQAQCINDRTTLTYMTKAECLTGYATGTRDLSDVILVASGDVLKPGGNLSSSNNSLLASQPVADPLNSQDAKWRWMCGVSNSFICGRPDLWLANQTIITDWNVYGYKIDHCLSRHQDLDGLCSVNYSIPIMIVVAVANLFKVACIFFTTWLYATSTDATPLSTLGDAAVSFLETPDETTKDMSLVDRTNIDRLWDHTGKPQVWEPSRKRWAEVISWRLWVGTIVACAAVLLGGLICLVSGLQTVARRTNASSPVKVYLAALGFGSPNQYETASLGKWAAYHWSSSGALYISIAWANCWQVLVSLCYVQYNTLLTTFLVGQEWSRFACATTSYLDTAKEDSRSTQESVTTDRSRERNPSRMGVWLARTRSVFRDHGNDKVSSRVPETLRVSEPRGIQRSTYFVSMPMRYGIPLISAMATIHFLLSQSIFVVANDAYKYKDLSVVAQTLYLSGFSIQALIATITLGFMLIVVLVVLGVRRYPADMPMASSCSAAISAACHPPIDDNEAALFPLQWGVVSQDKNGVGHCSLTTARDVTAPVVGRLYA